MKNLDKLAWALMIVGALNWGFIGLSQLNVLESILGSSPQIVQFVYILIGLSGLYTLTKMKKR